MRTERFHEEHNVDLSEEEVGIRDRQASRMWPALAKQESAIVDRKAEHKAELSAMETAKTTIITTARTAAKAATERMEPRLVECREEMQGACVVTIRCDTEETVRSRSATSEEMKEHDRRNPPMVPGGGAKRAATAPSTGHAPEGVAESLARALAEICAVSRNEAAVYKALAKAVPDSTPIDRKAAVASAIDARHLGETPDGKLLWAPQEPPAGPGDDGIVPDDYQPAATH